MWAALVAGCGPGRVGVVGCGPCPRRCWEAAASGVAGTAACARLRSWRRALCAMPRAGPRSRLAPERDDVRSGFADADGVIQPRLSGTVRLGKPEPFKVGEDGGLADHVPGHSAELAGDLAGVV